MKITRALKIFSVVALAVLLFCLVLAAGNSINEKFLSDLASHIPFLKAFVVKDYQTSLFRHDDRRFRRPDKIARYDIGLSRVVYRKGRPLHRSLSRGRRGGDQSLKRRGRTGKRGVISIPRPAYRAKLDQDNANSLVFMDSLSLDYNRMVAARAENVSGEGVRLLRSATPRSATNVSLARRITSARFSARERSSGREKRLRARLTGTAHRWMSCR